MSNSLADTAVRGAHNVRFATPEQELLAAGDIEGLIALKHSIFGAATMKDEPDDDDTDDDTDDGDDDDDDDEDDDDDADDKGKKSAADKRIEELQAENKRRRLRARKDKQALADLQAQVEELKKGKPSKSKKSEDDDDEDDDKSSEELRAEREKSAKLEERLVNQQLRMEFNDLTTGSKALAQFKNPKAAFRLLDLDDVDIDDDGTIDGLDDAIKALAKSDPYLLVEDDADDDDDDDDKGARTQQRSRTRNRRTGQPRGSSGKKGEPSRDKLVQKYRIQR